MSTLWIDRLQAAVGEWERTAGVGVKIAAFFVVWIGLWLPIAVPLARRWNWLPLQPLTPARKLALVGSLYLGFPLVLWGATVVEAVSFSHYVGQWDATSLKGAIAGLTTGILGLTILVGVQYICGWINWQLKFDGRAIAMQFGSALAIGVWIAGTEEILFRGFLQTQLQASMSPWTAAAIASAIFAVLHSIWGIRAALPQLPGLWLMGMILTQACELQDGNLSLAWGLHAGWILCAVWLDSSKAAIATDTAPPWLVGFDGQPLAGVLGLGLLLGTGGLLGIAAG